MKRLAIAVLAVAALAGCTENISQPKGNPEGEAVPVTLSAGIGTDVPMNAPTKASVESTDNFIAAVGGWTTNGTVDYAQDTTWFSRTSSIAGNAKQAPVTLTPAQVYEPDDAYKTYMKAWYPDSLPAGGEVSFPNADGSVDVMLASEIVGSKWDKEGKELVFNHLTTQLKFNLVDKSLVLPTTVEYIRIKGAELPVGIDLTADALICSSAADLDVPEAAGVAITEEGVLAGQPVMIRPMDGNTVTLDIKTDNALYEGVTATIDGDASFLPGKAYTITLNFIQEEVELTATVTEWDNTGKGSGTIL